MWLSPPRLCTAAGEAASSLAGGGGAGEGGEGGQPSVGAGEVG